MTLRTYQTARGQDKRRVDKVFGGLAGHGFGWRGSFKPFHVARSKQGAHLGDGDVVEGGEAFGLWQALADPGDMVTDK